MEQNQPAITKKVWNVTRTMLYMLKKGISKGKLMAELNMMFKRWKIAGKTIQNLMFHHSHHWSTSSSSTADAGNLSFPYPRNEYEFSCSNSPAYPNFHLPFHLNNKRKHNHRAPFSPSPAGTEEEDYVTMNAVVRTLEMLNSAAASPALPGFGKSPMVRQPRVTDSPFPLRNADEDNHIDEAADEFIKRFHNYLRGQKE
ncbi:Hypothetical predicted protein [Olea europaea subsp. europaea]|uniref:Avr9/Cf-9 rapidly elicited protein 146 n=2 Tax=Olea europaea subsp. europaea TaxID=158383 RepID=A0A8S0U8R5_OLEEU|nr:Hypothetical predicted protein [Olea europaea subsp. europaea]